MPAPFAGPQPASAPRRSLGTSGVFAVADLSPSINPTNVDGSPMAWIDVLKAGPRDKIANLAVAALEALRTQGLAAQHACRQIHGDRNLGEAEKHRRAAKTSADLLLAAQPPVEKAIAAAGKSIEELTKILAGPDIEVSDVKQVEIRSKLAGLPADKRFAAISRAIARGDDTTVAAVLGSDRLLTDFLGDGEFEATRSLWATSRHAEEVLLLAKRKSDLSYLERSASVSRSWQQRTHNPAIAATEVVGTFRGIPGPVPVDRGRLTGITGIAARARGFR